MSWVYLGYLDHLCLSELMKFVSRASLGSFLSDNTRSGYMCACVRMCIVFWRHLITGEQIMTSINRTKRRRTQLLTSWQTQEVKKKDLSRFRQLFHEIFYFVKCLVTSVFKLYVFDLPLDYPYMDDSKTSFTQIGLIEATKELTWFSCVVGI